MAFQSLRDTLKIDQREPSLLSSCGMNGLRADDADIILQGLIQLQKLREKGTLRNELLMDPLFPVAVYHPTFKLDDRFALASCMIRLSDTDPTPTPIEHRRRSFRAILSVSPPSEVIPEADGVSKLSRSPIAQARVIGWEQDLWFLGPEGRRFVKFWKEIHPDSLPVVTLKPDQTITAVLFFGLQASLSCLQDMVEEIDSALEEVGVSTLTPSERSTSITNIIRDIRSSYQDAAFAAAFLPKPLENFADGFELVVQECWMWAEHLRLASNGTVDVDEVQIALGTCSTARHEFIHAVRRLRRASESWTHDPAKTAQSDKMMSDLCGKALDKFILLNRCAASVHVPSVALPSLDGLRLGLHQSVMKLQQPFAGTVVPTRELSGGGAVQSMVTLTSVEGSIQSWTDLESWLRTLSASKGGGVAFLRHNCVLLPVNRGIPQDKWIGGKVEPGEDWWTAACRELDEETFVRADPWVHRVKRSSKPDTREVLVDGEPVEWKRGHTWPLGSVLVARSNGVQLERDVEVPSTTCRMSTRDVLRTAFDSLDVQSRTNLLRSMRVSHELQGDKTYRTLLIPLDNWDSVGRMPSIVQIPTAFSKHANDILMCCDASFDDVFADEPLDVNWDAMRNFEEEGFQWVPLHDAGPRIQNVLLAKRRITQ